LLEDLSWLFQYLQQGDLFGFFTAIFTRLIGDIFWGFILLFIAIPLYIRYQSIIPVAILFIGLGSLFIRFVPFTTFGTVYVLLGFGVGALLYKGFTSLKK